MPKPPQPRDGERLEILRRAAPFSFWPTRRLRAHAREQSILFSLDPWVLLKQVVTDITDHKQRAEALACLEQARDFFIIGTERGVEAARPLALYYSYMNLSKVHCLSRSNNVTFDRAQHGLAERPDQYGRTGLDYSVLKVFPSPNHEQLRQVFDDLMQALTGSGIANPTTYPIKYLLPQILSGHRLWAQAVGKRERFISFHDIQFWRNTDTKEVWLRLYVYSSDLSRHRVSHKKFLERSQLNDDFIEVQCHKKQSKGGRLLCFEQTNTETYPDKHPADVLENLVATIKPRLWTTIATVSPYRRYYAYLCPDSEEEYLLPQLMTIYALTYYLGSITRYRPQDFDGILSGKYGPRIHDFITGQALQFLYLEASEIAQQNVTKPSIL